ncbi:hypothetical protein K488DRAFT_85248 [Vararia minispora EC-137]|uniref:Uncharacterized protein n=1 Tax=Vararia minispora EC-137 TaxID=1314806 RepID=A0ACB8QN84_9AGAM|nr:hypothetical protein K488DRAFT_85248 [Vararia minispora EC-137]
MPSRLAAFTCQLLSALSTIGYCQVPQNPLILLQESYDAWMEPPHPDATGHHIFNSVASAMQLWPNSMWPAGHNIIPASIPPWTVLYRGERGGKNLPVASGKPKFLAFDPEHAYNFCEFACRIDSYITTRELKLLYFDGTSAGKYFIPTVRSLEVQDLLTWGELKPDKDFDEAERIKALCEWAGLYGLDGFVRMEYDFELLSCNISSGIEFTSSLDVLPKTPWTVHMPGVPNAEPWEPPEGWHGELPNYVDVMVQGIVAGAWHHRNPGETRVRVDVSGLISFYDPALRSLISFRRGVPRRRHQLAGISSEDIKRKLEELKDVLTRETRGSGVDWRSIADVVIARYSARLEQLNYTLVQETAFQNASARAAAVRQQLLVVLTPYLTPRDIPHNQLSSNSSWISPAVTRCSSALVGNVPEAILTPQERVIRHAFLETTGEICRRLGLMWAEAYGIDNACPETVQSTLEGWRNHILELMEWLDCSQIHVEAILIRASGYIQEFCYLSTWPHVLVGDDQDDKMPRCVPSDRTAYKWPSLLGDDA